MAMHWGLPHWPAPKYEVGDIVSYGDGRYRNEGRITEDRGAYGQPLRHIYEIEISYDDGNALRTEVPEDRLTLESTAKARIENPR